MQRKQEININFIQKNHGDLVNKDWRKELTGLLGELMPWKQASALVKKAQLKDQHYRTLYEFLYNNYFPFIINPWQLQLLTGEACYIMSHLLKKDHKGNNAGHYAVMVGAGPEILEKIRNNAPALLLAQNNWHWDLIYCFSI